MGLDKLDVYTVIAIISPGSVLALAVLLIFPDPIKHLSPDGVTIGVLGIYVMASFAAGHLIQAIGNVFEAVFWRNFGGWPTNQVIKPSQTLISVCQRQALAAIVKERWNVDIENLDNPESTWSGLTKQIHAELSDANRCRRLEVFVGEYGLNRGLFVAFCCTAVAILIHTPQQWPLAVVIFISSGLVLYRMHRRGRQYATELFVQFLAHCQKQ